MVDEFKNHPTKFFTEHDIASRAYSLIQEGIQYKTVDGIDGSMFYVVHHEYPTPFRCDMSKSNFQVKSDTERTPESGGKFKRGHYDLVVFNPDFLAQCDYAHARAQDYKLVPEILKMAASYQPAIFLGVEFMLNREKIKSQAYADRWIKYVQQDYNKLKATTGFNQFIGEPVMLALDCYDHAYVDYISKSPELQGVWYVNGGF